MSKVCCGYSVSETVHFANPQWMKLGFEAAKVRDLLHRRTKPARTWLGSALTELLLPILCGSMVLSHLCAMFVLQDLKRRRIEEPFSTEKLLYQITTCERDDKQLMNAVSSLIKDLRSVRNTS